MFDSKALKDFEPEKHSKLYSWWIQTDLYDWIHDMTYKFWRRPIQSIKKLYGWHVNVFKNDYDFDGHSLYAIIEYKLKRVLPALEDGHAIQEPKDLKALKLAIKLAGRLKDDNYSMRAWDRHGKKWGELKTWFTPCEGKEGYSTWNSSRPKAVTEEEKEQERKEHLAGSLLSDKVMEREQKWLFDILRKHLRYWWD